MNQHLELEKKSKCLATPRVGGMFGKSSKSKGATFSEG